MAQGKKTFIFYSDWTKLINAMPSEQAGDLLKLMLAYVNDEQPEEPSNPFVIMAWAHIKPMLKVDLKQWENKKKRFSEMGKKSASQRRLTQVEPTLTVNDNVNVNVNVNDNVNDNDNKEQSYITHRRKNAPEFNDVYLYAQTLDIWDESFTFQLQAKYDSWIEAGWKDGRNKPIKNWKTKLRNTLPYFKKQHTNESFRARDQREVRTRAEKVLEVIEQRKANRGG